MQSNTVQSIDVETYMQSVGRRARAAAILIAKLPTEEKNKALLAIADRIQAQQGEILEANALDMQRGRDLNLTAALLDRLDLNADRINAMARGCRQVAALPDPVGEMTAFDTRPSGIKVGKMRVPLGVIGIIYESRPNVTIDAAALCFKSGNAVILRGGSESFHSSTAIHVCLTEGLRAHGLPEHAIQLVPTRDRAAVSAMLHAVDHIDVIIPRGGKGLVGLVQKEARVPVFAHLEGICHVYVDGAADLEKARRVLLNAKTRRTGICGSAETLLVDRAFYDQHGDILVQDLLDAGVEVRGDPVVARTKGAVAANPDDFGHEFLDMVIAAKIVDGVDAAIAHIRQFGSNHTDAILTEDDAIANKFFHQLDSAILMRNASTQFADGGEFGMGAEIGIATGKLHARGPVGAMQLTSFKYLVTGDGTVRP